MIAIISDIHANYEALKSVVADAKDNGCTEYICLGDIAGYHSEINQTIELLKGLGNLRFILGNHDVYLIEKSGCPRSKLVTASLRYQESVITTDNLIWLTNGVLSIRHGDTLFTHGGPHDTQEQYIYKVREETFPSGTRRIFCGHTHVQKILKLNEKQFCNPGSVGQPRDGDARAAYAILDGDNIHLRRVKYDIEKTQDAMKQAGFAEACYLNLSHGTQVGGRIDDIKLVGESSR